MLLIVLIIHLNVIRGHQVFGHGLEFFRVFLTRLPWFHLIRFELKIFVYSYSLASYMYVPFRIESAVFGSCHLVIIFVKSNWAESIFDQFGNSFSKSSIILESITNAGRRGYSFKDSGMIAMLKIISRKWYAQDVLKWDYQNMNRSFVCNNTGTESVTCDIWMA